MDVSNEPMDRGKVTFPLYIQRMDVSNEPMDRGKEAFPLFVEALDRHAEAKCGAKTPTDTSKQPSDASGEASGTSNETPAVAGEASAPSGEASERAGKTSDTSKKRTVTTPESLRCYRVSNAPCSRSSSSLSRVNSASAFRRPSAELRSSSPVAASTSWMLFPSGATPNRRSVVAERRRPSASAGMVS